MALTKRQKGMVFHQEGEATPAAATAGDHPPACFVVLKQEKASDGGMEQSPHVTNDEGDMMGKPNSYPSKEAIRTSAGPLANKHPVDLNPQSDTLSPDSFCRGIRVTLDNNSMWNEFFRCKTEMILTQQGSRMFPYCRFRISGLQPSRKYSMIMDIQPLDNSCYKWTSKSWQVAGRADRHIKSQPFAHPESPSTGQHWMKNPVSFYKLKLTSNITDQEGNTILNPMHRYLPRLHVIPSDKAAKDLRLNGPSVVTFTFPQTEFMAVSSYQNSRFSQLKIDYNPFTRGLKEDGFTSKGLKLKLKSGNNLQKGGSPTVNEQHPLKKSLKSLLSNHKPRSSKAIDSKSLIPGNLQKKSSTNGEPSAAKVTEECSGNSRPAQKLFSELIREAHVSLQRCNLEQLAGDNSQCHRTEQTNTKTSTIKNVPSSAKNSETNVTSRTDKEAQDHLNSLKEIIKADFTELKNVASPAVSQKSSFDSNDNQHRPETQPEVNVKQHKRPAPLPLPALALFLKQHSMKSKKAKSKLYSSPHVLPLEPVSELKSSPASSESQPSNCTTNATSPLKELPDEVINSSDYISDYTNAHPHPSEMACKINDQSVEIAHQSSSPTCHDVDVIRVPTGPRTDDVLTSISVAESTAAVPDGTSVLPGSDQPFCILGTPISKISPTLTTSSQSPGLSPHLDKVIPVPNSEHTSTINESSTLPSDTHTTISDSLLPDPVCSFDFEPLSNASSPGPLPSLPASLALQLDSVISEPSQRAVPPEELQPSEVSATSVFKWHTVLPPPERYTDAMDTSFTAFQPTPQSLESTDVSPLLPPDTPSLLKPQTFDTSASTSIPDAGPSFQENEHSLPFPAELSPLALQLPLSPTFSSLDGDGLSPTPSLTDLVHLFSADDLGMGVDFSNTETVAVSCPTSSTVEGNANEISQQVFSITDKRKRKTSRQRKHAKTDMDQGMDVSTYTLMQPNLEEVEEQLFISFTSKEALKLHVVDPSEEMVSEQQTTPEDHLQQTIEAPENEIEGSLEENIAAFEKILLRDLKLMRHRQVIHPVLQEVGLKLNLLDPTLAIDLQYLGVRLPIPPPGVSLEPLTQELPPSQGISATFVSRTGKTTDMTQIKGWREKFPPSEPPSTPAPNKPEAGPSSDLPKKNLSAFCSDMLDEYLENEGKLIDERAASFSQPVVEPVVYELPTRSTSYVRTLDNILKKQTDSSPTSDLISGFVPPSKRPKLNIKETRTSKRENAKQRGQKHNKPRAELVAALSPGESDLVSKHTTDFPSLDSPTVKKRKRFKPKILSQTLSPSKAMAPLPNVSGDMAPLESDSELGTANGHGVESSKKVEGQVMTRALLKQKDLEDGVVWEGKHRTYITEERATIALKSLFTLMGFASENPTAPIQLNRRRAPRCLNEFCRLGCVCSSLSYCSRISHCGRPSCMLGCSCLKQKVVLLKNLDGSDSSPSHHGNNKRRKRKRRMKMAYILKEEDSVSQPAERIRTLWKRDGSDSHPDPTYIPTSAFLTSPKQKEDKESSCARIRGYRGARKTHQKKKESLKDGTSACTLLPPLKERHQRHKKTKPSRHPPDGNPDQPDPSEQPQSPPAEPSPKPSKRLTVLADCKWTDEQSQSLVLKELCERMAKDQLDKPFWISEYLIRPMKQTVQGSGIDQCIQYKIHVCRPKLEPETPVPTDKPRKQGKQWKIKQQKQDHQNRVVKDGEPLEDWQREEEEPEPESLEDWQREVEEEEVEPLEDWQREVEEEEAEPLEEWQREVEEDDINEEGASTVKQVHDGKERRREENKKKSATLALPFLTGISPAGFLSAKKKHPGQTDHLIQVNGKHYPLAKIQLGKMGALHPANRLAAYLTGRVGSNRKEQSSSSSASLSNHPQNRTLRPTPQTVPTATPSLRSQTAPTALSLPISSTEVQPAAMNVNQSVASSHLLATEGKESRVVVVRVKPVPSGGASPVTVVPQASGSPTPMKGPQVSSSGVLPVNMTPRRPQMLMVQVPVLPGKAPSGPTAPGPPPTTSTHQRMVLQVVKEGVHYYRKPDGQMVHLIPISQLKSANPNQSIQGGLSLPSAPSSTLNQTPVITVVNKSLPVTTETTTTSSSSSPSSLSGYCSVPVPAPPSTLVPTSDLPAQKGICTFKILNTSKKQILVTNAKGPSTSHINAVKAPDSITIVQPHPTTAPLDLTSLKLSTHQGNNLGIKTVAVSAVPVNPGGLIVRQKPASPEPSTIQTSLGTTHNHPTLPLASLGSEVTLVPTADPPINRNSPRLELARDQMDVDIICVDDKTGLATTQTAGGEKYSSDVVDLGVLPGSETEDSSDFEDEMDSEEKKRPSNVNIRDRLVHCYLERQRREKMQQLFDGLKTEVGLIEARTSKVFTLLKAAQVIQELKSTENNLKKKKMRLTKRRDALMNSIAPATEESRQEAETGSTDDSLIEVVYVDETDAFTSKTSDEDRLVVKAHQEIQVLQTEAERLKSVKVSLKQQRDAFIRHISQMSGKSEQRILRKLQHLSSKQKKLEKRSPATNQLSNAGGAPDPAGGDATDDNILITSSNLEQQTVPAPATPAPSTTTTVQTPINTSPQPPQTVNQRVPHLSKSTLACPHVSHNSSVLRDRPRTVPNILSRSKKTVTEPFFQTVVPAEVLSLVGAALPIQQVMTLSPLMAGQTLLQTSSAPGLVTFNIPNLTNQKIHLGPMPNPPEAGNLNNVLQVVQPWTEPTQQEVPAGQPTPPPPPPLVVTVGSDQIKDQDQAPSQTDHRPESSSSPPCNQETSSSPCQGPSTGLHAEVTSHRNPEPELQKTKETRDDPEGLTSLLNEIVFLNQKTPATGLQEEEHAHSPWLLQLDSDSDDYGTVEKEEASLEEHKEMTQTRPLTRPTSRNTSGGVLTPPPLLQMRMGGAKVVDPISRPMPRLVPLGLRSNPPS